MDWLDKEILKALYANARIPLQDLAQKYDLSYNAIKKRVKNLEKIGAIQEYTVDLSRNMLGGDRLLAIISTDGTEDVKTLVDQIGNHSFISGSSRRGHQLYEAQAIVCGAPEFFELKQFLESLDSVTAVEIHPYKWFVPGALPQSKVRTRGKKVKFSKTQLRVLQCLTDDVRMSVSEIAKRTGLTSRRISNSLRELQEGGGVHFTIRVTWATTSTVALGLWISYNEKKVTVSEIGDWLQEQFPLEFMAMIVYLDEPKVHASFCVAGVADLSKVTEIIQTVRAAPFAEFVEDNIVTKQSYSSGIYPGRSPILLDEMFKEAGL